MTDKICNRANTAMNGWEFVESATDTCKNRNDCM